MASIVPQIICCFLSLIYMRARKLPLSIHVQYGAGFYVKDLCTSCHPGTPALFRLCMKIRWRGGFYVKDPRTRRTVPWLQIESIGGLGLCVRATDRSTARIFIGRTGDMNAALSTGGFSSVVSPAYFFLHDT
jgi:hypothetical protein